MKRPIVLHPLLLTLYPLFFLYSINLGQMRFSEMTRAQVFFPILAGLVWLGLWRLLKNAAQAGLLVSLGVLLFFSFGHIAKALSLPVMALLLVWAGLLVGLSLLIVRKLRSFAALTQILNVVSLVLVGFTLVSIVRFTLEERGMIQTDAMRQPAYMVKKAEADNLPQPSATPRARPDIYYIVLDGYGQSKMIEDVYGYDNQPFEDALRQRGFVVAEDAHSNYPQTLLSLASSLNFAYLDEMVILQTYQYSREPMINFIHNSRAQRFLQSQGYQVVGLETGYGYTNLSSADVFIRSPFELNAYEQQLLSSTVLMPWYNQIRVAVYRQDRAESVRRLQSVVGLDGPKFVFAHILLPHPPFMFKSDGSPQPLEQISISDGSHYERGRADYLERYPEQLQHTNTLILQTLDQILANSVEPPVIILQGDHGPGAYLDWENLERSCLAERLSILNAYYLPGEGAAGAVYPSITPVNTMRLVFDAYLGTDLGLVDDRNYYAQWSRPYDLREVTDRVGTCGPLGW